MYISYFDETGDDGYPKRITELFVLTSGSMQHDLWQTNFKRMLEFRRQLRKTYGFPIKLEMHTKHFLLNKNPYRSFGWDNATRLKVIREYATLIATLDIEFINVIINKSKINTINESMYRPILDAALTFNVQRIENTIKASQPGTKFMIISDEGRIGAMQNTTRRIQKINYIPSKIASGSYRKEISLMIEDPLPKNSNQSYFIQACDFVSFFVYLQLVKKLCVGVWHGRLGWLSEDDVKGVLDILDPVLNHKANSGKHEYGFVIYPE